MADNTDQIPFLGTGWSFPPVFNKLTSTVEMRKGNNDILESLHILLSTIPGERLLDPDYGCDLTELLFENITTSLKTTLSERIHRAIVEYEPRVSYEAAEFTPDLDNGVIYINIQYVIRSTNSRTNMVYPYYMKEGTNL